MKRLEGKTAWVTGAGSGIGRAIAISFAAEGAKVALTGRRVAPLEETAKMIGSGAVIVPADLTDEKQVAAALAKVESTIGGPDILVNNAGVNLPKRYLHQLTPEAIRSLVDGNLTARRAYHPNRLHGREEYLLPVRPWLYGGEAWVCGAVAKHQSGKRHP
jgi:NAD(P)-dependent dehydrogenase (short-subunit alcohol dehydrogenase family)